MTIASHPKMRQTGRQMIDQEKEKSRDKAHHKKKNNERFQAAMATVTQ